MNPIASVNVWMRVAKHGPQHQKLYHALVAEEGHEHLRELLVDPGAIQGAMKTHVETVKAVIVNNPGTVGEGAAVLLLLSKAIREQEAIEVKDREAVLDAALDLAWVALCLAHTLTGDSLQSAWDELHRANVSSKIHPDGLFHLDKTGKVLKPEGWKPPNMAQFLIPVTP